MSSFYCFTAGVRQKYSYSDFSRDRCSFTAWKAEIEGKEKNFVDDEEKIDFRNEYKIRKDEKMSGGKMGLKPNLIAAEIAFPL